MDTTINLKVQIQARSNNNLHCDRETYFMSRSKFSFDQPPAINLCNHMMGFSDQGIIFTPFKKREFN